MIPRLPPMAPGRSSQRTMPRRLTTISPCYPTFFPIPPRSLSTSPTPATPASMPAAHCARCSTKPNKCTERAAAAARSVFDLLRSKRKIHNRVSFFLCDRYTIDETLCSCFQLSAYSLLSKFGISFRFERLNSFTAASKGSSNGNGV